MTALHGMTRPRGWAIARGMLVVAALVLLPLAALLQTPRPGAAQSAVQDSLWAGGGSGAIGACLSPGTAAALSDCFRSASATLPVAAHVVAADGENVYFATPQSGGLSCPIADLGANCTRIMTGPWPTSTGAGENDTWALAASDGMIWIGQQDGKIYRCPANIPYAKQSTMPAGCVLLDDAGIRPVESLLLANGRLYAGLGSYDKKNQGMLWNCDPQAVNACEYLDSYGGTYARSLTAGGGYLWAGLSNGIVWRCNLDTVDDCANWEKAGNVVMSLSYDGQGILYAAISGKNGVIWSCPAASANGCKTLISDVNGISVAAGDGNVFSGTGSGLYFGSSQFTGALSGFKSSEVLYLPAGGPVGVGATEVTVSAGKWVRTLDRRCDSRGKNPKATVTVSNGSGVVKSQKIGLCELQNAATVTRTFNLLDDGDYTVTARTKKHGGSRSFTVEQNQTGNVSVRMTRAGWAK